MQNLSSAAEEQKKWSSGVADGSKHKENPLSLHTWDRGDKHSAGLEEAPALSLSAQRTLQGNTESHLPTRGWHPTLQLFQMGSKVSV